MTLATHMEAVARHLLGEPNEALSKKNELRFGNHGSLAVDLKKGIWFDHQNQTGGGVISLIERERKIVNGLAVEWMRKELGIEIPDNTRQPIAEYPYTDETGNLLFEVCRFEPKDFRQRRPDGRGGWIWNLATFGAFRFTSRGCSKPITERFTLRKARKMSSPWNGSAWSRRATQAAPENGGLNSGNFSGPPML